MRTLFACVAFCGLVSSFGTAARADEFEAAPKHNYFVGGLDTYFGSAVGPAITLAGAHVFGDDYGFVFGARAAEYFRASDTPIFRIGLDIGYRGYFARDVVSVGVLVLAQPEMYPGSTTSVGGGVSAGPFFEYKRLHIQIMAGVSYSETTKVLVGNSPSTGDLAHASLLLGPAF